MYQLWHQRGLLLLLLFWVAIAAMADNAGYQTPETAQAEYRSSSPVDRLGVRMISPIYATIRDGNKNVTVALTVWLRRVGAAKGPFDLPHQAKDAIRMLVWVEKPDDLHKRKFGHMVLPYNHSVWQPELLLETAEPGPVLQVLPETGQQPIPPKIESALRPYSLRVELPAGVGDCFKLIEPSYPKHKFPICLPPAAKDGVCAELAPPARHTASAPALYMTIAPVRLLDPDSSVEGQCAADRASLRDWQQHYGRWAVRLRHYLEYHVAMGASGLLLYTDELMRRYLAAAPDIRVFLENKQLRLVEWDLPERSHEDDDGLGRPLGYNYDQALFAGHAWLGLSACGANLMLLVTDLDEYLHSPRPHVRWPAPLTSCMGHRGGAARALRAVNRTSGGPPGARRAATTTSRTTTTNRPSTDNNRTIRSRRLLQEAALTPTTKTSTNSTTTTKSTAISDYRLLRYDILAGDIDPDEEAELWATRQDGKGSGSSSNNSSSSSVVSASHPLSHYTLIAKQPYHAVHAKVLGLPAANMVLFFVHEGHVLYGKSHVVDPQCLVLLHVINYHCARRMSSDRETLKEFSHWMFRSANATTKGQQPASVAGQP
ncbi:hypothetical protein Agub_g801 [Astrephomene gubernaculifera]|uniref:Glycosyltransferase family 92 protein n=1 Tax=Astrephomene gubernaculifera TaxID=47775 RepID=A0AAD3HGX9_9CHLO|nr:hypothetical protein Agub_g801 [Astrephomene gubernaculifera]